MASYYIRQNGRVTGPLGEEELARRIELNVVRSLDRISEDGEVWEFVKDSKFWHHEVECGGQVDMPFLQTAGAGVNLPMPTPLPTRMKR